MAETKVIKEKKEAAPKAKAAKAAKPKAARPKAAPKAQLSKEDVQSAVYEAVKAAALEIKAAETPKEAAPVAPVKEVKKIKCTSDERLMSSLAIIYLVLGLLCSVALIITGIVLEATEDSFMAQYLDGPDMGLICIIVGVVLLLPTLVQYACMKLFANISHRLTSLDKK